MNAMQEAADLALCEVAGDFLCEQDLVTEVVARARKTHSKCVELATSGPMFEAAQFAAKRGLLECIGNGVFRAV